MKQKRLFSFFFSMLMAMVLALPMYANEVTVSDGSSTTSYVPVYGLYCDYYIRTQVIYPADSLDGLENASISGIKFYLSNTATEAWTSNFEVCLMEVNDKQFTSGYVSGTSTVVYSGTLDATASPMVITFDNAYSYDGGNLLIEIHSLTTGNYKSASFSGSPVSNCAIYGSNSSSVASITNGSRVSVLPKATFVYTPGAPVSCEKVGALVLGTPAADNMKISWSKGGEETSWLFYLDGAEEVVTDTFKVLNGLISNTEYSVAVRALCGAGDTSKVRSASFTTPCGIEALPFAEDFNTLTTGIPSCWDNSEGTTTSATYKWSYNANGLTGACVRFNSYNNPDGKTNYLQTPQIALSADAQLEYAWKNNSAGDLDIYIQKVGESTRKKLANHPSTGTTNWTEEEINLSAYTGDTVIFLFMGTSNNGYGDAYIYLDNIKVRPQPNCKKVSDIHAENPTLSGFDIAWTAGGSEGAWDVVIVNGNDTLFNDQVTENKVTLSSLNASSRYTLKVSVVADCGSEKADAKNATVVYETECAIILPVNDSIVLNADGFVAGALPACYQTSEYVGTSATYRWQISSSYCHSGSRCFQSPTTYIDASTVVLTLPMMEIPENSEISLWAREGYSTEASDSLVIYINDSASLNDAVCVGVVKGLNISAHQFFRFPLSEIRGNKYVMIEHHGSYAMYVDDIMISPAPNCFPVTHIALGEILSSTVGLSWQAGGEEEAWLYSYSFMADDSTVVVAEDQEATENSVVMEGFSPSKHYKGSVSVMALCESSESEWAEEEFEFTMMCEPLALTGEPEDTVIVYGFDDWSYGQTEYPCWSIEGDGTSSSYLQVWNANGSARRSGNFGLQMVGKSSVMKSSWLVLPVMSIDQADEFELSFWASCLSNSSDNDSISVYVSNSEEVDSARFVAKFTGLTTAFQNFKVLLPAGEYVYVMIKGCDAYESYSSSASNGINLDDIAIRRLPVCRTVKDLKVSNLGTNFGEVSWVAGNEETEWNVRVIHNSDTMMHNGLTEPKLRFDSLQANLEYSYTVRVVAVCSGVESAESVEQTLTFRTLCEAETEFPIFYGFEASEGFTGKTSGSVTNTMPSCWGNEVVKIGATSNAGYLWYANNSGSNVRTGSQCLCLPDKGLGNRTLLTLPSMVMDATKEYELSLWINRTGKDNVAEGFRVYASHSAVFGASDTIDLGLVTRMYNIKTAVCDSLAASGWDHVIIPIPMTGEVTLFFMGESYYKSHTYVDDVEIREKPLCDGATGLAIVDSLITTNSATFVWEGNSDAGYDVQFIFAGGDTINKHVAQTSCVLDNLQSSKDYSVKVKVIAQCVAGAAVDVLERSFTFATECVEIAAVPWSCDFEGVSTSGYQMPACWSAIKSGNYPYVYAPTATYKCQGDQVLYLYGGATSSQQYAILPKFASSFDWSNARIKLMYRNSSAASSFAFLTLGYMTNPADASTFVALDTLEKVASYVQYEYYLDEVPAGTPYLALRLAGGTAATTYVDMVEITEIPSCFPGSNIHVIDSTKTKTSIQIAWSPFGEEESWHLILKQGNETLVDSIVADTLFTLNGLTHSTAYQLDAKVYTICGVGQESTDPDQATLSFQTECDVIASFPWSENFDGYAAGTTTFACMRNVHVDGTGANLYKTVASPGGTNTSMTLQLPDQKNTEVIMLALPQMNIPEANAYEFSLDIYRNATAASYLTEGVDIYVSATDTLDASAQKLGFLPRNHTVANEVVTAEAAAGWYTYRMAIPMQGTCYIIIRSQSQWGSSTYMDNAQVAAMPDCRKVSGIALDSYTKSSAVFSWTPGAKESEWEVVIKSGKDTLAHDSVFELPKYQLNGLQPGTAYTLNVEVKSCGEFSEKKEVSFTTFCEAMEVSELPWAQDFNAGTKGANVDLLCYQNIHVEGAGAKLFTYDEYFASGDSTMMLSLPDMNGGTITQLILPSINLPQANRYGFSIDIYRSAYDKDKEGVRVLAQNADTTIDLGFMYRQFTRTDSNIVVAESAAGIYRYEFPIPLAGEVRIILQGESQFGSATFMDNMMIRELPSCMKPAKLHVEAIGLDSAVIAWESDAEQFRLTLNRGEQVDTILVADTCYVLRGLNHSSHYSIAASVQALCGESEVSEVLATTLKFQTECAKISALPWSNDFESEVLNEMPICWSGVPYESYGSVYPCTKSNSGVSSSNCLYFNGGTSSSPQVIALPEFDASVDLSTARIKFDHRAYMSSSSYAALEFGYMLDSEQDSTFVVLATLGKPSSFTAVEILLDSVPAEAHFLAFRLHNSSSFQYCYVDNIEVSRQPSCKKVSDIQLLAVSAGDATFTWTAGEAEPQWLVVCNYNDEVKADTVQTNSFVLRNLKGMTQYACTLQVKALCSAEEVSDVVSAVFNFKTEMPAEYIQHLELNETFIANFDDDDEAEKWFQDATGTNKFMIGDAAAALAGSTLTKALYVSNNNADWAYTETATSYAVIARRFHVAGDSSQLAVHYEWQANGERTGTSSYYDFGRALMVPAGSQIQTSTSGATIGGTQVTGSTGSTKVPTGGFDLGNGPLALVTAFQVVNDTIQLVTRGNYDLVFVWGNDNSSGAQNPLAIRDVQLKVISGGAGTGVENRNGKEGDQAVKIVRDGKVFILRGGEIYTVLGTPVEF